MCYFGEALKQQQGAPPECFVLSRECGYREVPRHATARRPAALDVAGAQSGLGSWLLRALAPAGTKALWLSPSFGVIVAAQPTRSV